ncbi:hypothetical protein SDC9_77624 [bioreactor metagenome]|uniref:Uncharacterized protein n=1 Tax=bioreactor metagenome TaxID=1076179 RepID=A0A644YT66_9ZZZZ
MSELNGRTVRKENCPLGSVVSGEVLRSRLPVSRSAPHEGDQRPDHGGLQLGISPSHDEDADARIGECSGESLHSYRPGFAPGSGPAVSGVPFPGEKKLPLLGIGCRQRQVDYQVAGALFHMSFRIGHFPYASLSFPPNLT